MTLFLVVQVPVMLGSRCLVALAIDSGRLYGRDFFRLTIFLPYAVPGVVAALMWGFMYGERFGLVGNLNDLLGTSIPDPLASALVLPAIGNIVTWEFVGYNMLIFYSALRVVPGPLYEAAEIDGAGPWRVIWAIKMPAIRGALVVATIFSIIGRFQLFNEPSILQALSPNTISTHYTPNLYAYNAVLLRPAVQLLGHDRDHHGRAHDGRGLRRAAARHAQGGLSHEHQRA